MDSDPYSYQPGMIQALRGGFANGHTRQLISASTGAGKSILMMEMVRLAVEKDKKVLFMCERRGLVEQFSAHLDRNGIAHGVIMDKTPLYRPNASVQVACVQSIERIGSLEHYDIMFLDELHMMLRKSVIQIMESRPKLKVIGATATPFHKLIGSYFTNTVSAPPMAALVGMGTLVPYIPYGAVPINTDGVRVKTTGEWDETELGERGKMIVGNVVTDYLDLSNKLFGRNSKAICFSASISHGAELAAAFNEQGINAVQLASGVDDGFRIEVLREFSRPTSSIDLLISVDMLSRGFDQTDVEHIILAKPIKKSLSNHIQMMGRGARKHEGKTQCCVQDHGENWIRFSDDFSEFYHNGAEGLIGSADAKAKKEPTEKEKKEAKCPACGAYWPIRSDVCVGCGHARVRHNDVVSVPGEMQELALSGAKQYKVGKKEVGNALSVWEQSASHCRNTGNPETAGKRTYHLYKSIVGTDTRGLPRFEDTRAVAVSSAIRSKAKANAIAYGKALEAARNNDRAR